LNERGALALSDPEAPDGFSFIDGLSITVLIVPGLSATRPHSHSWWHLFLVRSGRGAVRLEHGAIDDSSPTPIEAGDVLFVPAWREHSFRCSSTEDLSMLVFGNLPQQARLANKLERQSLESARSETLA
jgi:gentisate 1,2-dioxygenase